MHEKKNEMGEEKEGKILESKEKQWLRMVEEARLVDVLQNYANPKRVFWINFLAGLARGLGLTVGTALVLAFSGYLLSQSLSIPVVGEYVAEIVQYVKHYSIAK